MPPGGGGLVILPHKSWNVWNRDNKAKVAKDEEAHRQLIQAKARCKREVLQEIRFERLNGLNISQQEEDQRVQYALDNMDINDYIDDKSMRDIAKNINDKIQREKEMEESSSNYKNKNKKRKFKDMNLTEEQIKHLPRKRHKRNDVTIIEDHYNQKTNFEFDPDEYHEIKRKDYKKNNEKLMETEDKHKMNHNSDSHFSLFNEGDIKNKYNQSGYKLKI